MKSLVVYDSFFGNTEKIAQAVGAALGAQVVRVGSLTHEQLKGLDLLVVGSPTRAFRASPGTQAFLKGLPKGALAGTQVAAFDTRMTIDAKTPAFLRVMAKIFGYAAKPIAAGLKNHGGQLSVEPEGFIVKDTKGPLQEGELERAAGWGRSLAK